MSERDFSERKPRRDSESSERKPRREGDFAPRNPARNSDSASRGSRDSEFGTRKPRPAGVGGGRRDENFSSGRGRRDEDGTSRPAWQTRVARPVDPEKAKSPLIPEEITEKDLEIGVRVQLKTLTPENAEMVARHLAMASILIDQDPELAHKHALAAAQRAGRIAIVREIVGVTAYYVGDFALALRELLTHRRISGSNEQIALMVDCERGLGRPDRALELGRSIDRSKLDAVTRVNLAIAMSGARLDKGELDLAIAELEIKELDLSRVFEYSPDLFRAYGECLKDSARKGESDRWFDLANRAEIALLKQAGLDEEMVSVLEEINIPTAADRPKRDDTSRYSPRDGDRSARDGDRSGRDGDRPRRPFSDRPSRDGDRPSRSFGDRPNREGGRPGRPFGDRPRGDGDRAQRDGDRPSGPIRPNGKGPARDR
jgi:hypothetical protein